jgi:hypothetical protein
MKIMMKPLRTALRRAAKCAQESWASRRQKEFNVDCSLTEAATRFQDRNGLHAYMQHYFHHIAPSYVRDHRRYFAQEGRGFGEDAFHAMWFLLMREFRPRHCLEIGVFRGQIISLWAVIAREMDLGHVEVNGISPFSASGDAVSRYGEQLDYHEDVLKHHASFGLPQPCLLKAYSTDEEAHAFICSRRWDVIYIDGNHDYDVAKADYEICVKYLAEGGILVMDDSSLYTDFKPPLYSFAGHPGPSRVVQEQAMKELCFLAGIGHNNVFVKSNT